MPLLKGYDDYDKEISRLFGLESKEVLSLIEHHTKNPLRFKKMKTIIQARLFLVDVEKKKRKTDKQLTHEFV